MREAEPYIREIQAGDFSEIMRFSDENIGENYFSKTKLEEIFKASVKDSQCASLVLVDESGIQGIRLSFPPSQWIARHPSQAIHSELWQVELSDAAYFQSLFVAKKYQNQGWGKKLSEFAIDKLKTMGAKAVICHSWNESPSNSSRKYLDRLGFSPVISIPNYWKSIDYECTRCGKPPCVCSATEMVLYL